MNIVGGNEYIIKTEEGVRNTAKTCLQAVKETGAHVIVLGCIGLCFMANDISRFLEENGASVPIVKPGIVVMEYTKMLLRLSLNQSREMFRK